MMKVLALVLCLAALAGCGPTNNPGSRQSLRRAQAEESSEPVAEVMPHERCTEGVGEGDIRGQDVNGDGRPDLRTVMRGGQMYCRETDANFDGRVDILRFVDPEGRTIRVEDDYDFDGRYDVVAVYENGVIHSDVLDTNFDGRIDTWRDYQNGRVSELRRDANSDGRVDMWERFDANGRITFSGVDQDGDGRPDTERGDAGASAATDAAVNTTVSMTLQDGAVAPPSVPTGADAGVRTGEGGAP